MLIHKNVLQGIRCVFAKDTELYERLHWTLRISSVLCFIGHGAWGILKKPAWLAFYDIFGIPSDIAFLTMPLVGGIDIALGLIILWAPVTAVMVYMALWAVFTALLRPLAGMGWWEFLERAGNYGAPLALLYLSGFKFGATPWFKPVDKTMLDRYRVGTLGPHLRVYTSLLLIGHGGYGAFHKKAMLIDHWGAVGLPLGQLLDAAAYITCVGWFEIFLGAVILFYARPWLCMFIVGWKLATEFLYVVHGPVRWEIFEFIERWGSYGVPLALYFLLGSNQLFNNKTHSSQSEGSDETLPPRALVQH